MIARTLMALPGVIVSLMLFSAPALADRTMDGKKLAHTQQRKLHHARWDRYLHTRSARGGATSADDIAASDDAAVSADDGVSAPLDRQTIESGIASWYGRRHQGRITSSGVPFNQNDLTAAHPWLPLGSRVRVRLVGTGRAVDVTITDRPGTKRRIIDLSREAARRLGMINRGTALVALSHL